MQSENAVQNLLKIEPSSELLFTGPFDRLVGSNLQLINLTNKFICYKVKTTALTSYSVLENLGVIGPNLTKTVEIKLLPFEFDPEQKPKHKFKIQSLIAEDGQPDLQQLWRDAKPEEIMENKLKCVFKMPDTDENAGAAAAVAVQADDAKEVDAANVSVVKVASALPESLVEEMLQMEEVRELDEEAFMLKLQEMELTMTESDPPGNDVPTWHIVLTVVAVLVALFVGKYLL